MIIVNGWKPLTIITKRSILDVAAVLDPPLTFIIQLSTFYHGFQYNIVNPKKSSFHQTIFDEIDSKSESTSDYYWCFAQQ